MWPFDREKQHIYRQYANAWDQNNLDQIPQQDALEHYRQFVQNAPPDLVRQVHEQYYAQMPQHQRGGLIQSLMGLLTQRGFDPEQSGISSTDPHKMSPDDAARLTTYAQQKDPDLLHQILGPGGPLGSNVSKMAVAGLVSLAAKKILGSGIKL